MCFRLTSHARKHHGRGRALLGFLAGAALLALSACNTLPDSGPTERAVLKAAQNKQTNPLGFHRLPVTPRLAGVLSAEIPPLISSIDNAAAISPTNDRNGIGNTLTITVFELGSGLFAPSSGAAGAASTTGLSAGPAANVTNQNLPLTHVASAGTITLPYVPRGRDAGLSPTALSLRFLHRRAVPPQTLQ